MRPHPTLLCLALASAVVSACVTGAIVTPDRTARGWRLVQALANTQLRDAAYCELLSLGLYRRPKDAYQDTCGPVSEVVTAPQLGGPPLYIVFTEYEIERERIRRGPAGPYTLFDSYGFIIPVFASANLVDHESELFPYSPSGNIAIASVIGVSSGSALDEGHWSVQTLNVVPATAAQASALSVVLGPPTFGFDDQCAGDFWSWRYDDADADGWPEIHIGPRTDADGNIAPAATFRWSSTERRFVGPNGSVREQFIQFQPDDRSALDVYAEAWRNMQDERTGYRISWCQSVKVDVPLGAVR